MKLADFGFLLLGVALNAGAQLGLKSATLATGPIRGSGGEMAATLQKLLLIPAFWLALLAYGCSVIAWVVGLSRVPVSQAYPMLSLGYIATALLAWMLLNEPLSAARWTGIGVIIVGVWLVSRS